MPIGMSTGRSRAGRTTTQAASYPEAGLSADGIAAHLAQPLVPTVADQRWPRREPAGQPARKRRPEMAASRAGP